MQRLPLLTASLFLLAAAPLAPCSAAVVDPAIVYLKGTSSRTDLYVMDADGTDRTVVRTRVGRGNPVWSPNGLQVAYVSSYRVYVCNRNGTNVVQVGLSSEVWPSISWSPVPAPDGHYRIAYHSFVASTGSSELFLVDPNGQNTQQLTATPCTDEYSTTWSRDGARMAVDTWDDFGTHVELLTLASPAPGVCTVAARQELVGDPSFSTWFTGLDWGRATDQLAYTVVNSTTGSSQIWILTVGQPGSAHLLVAGSRASWSPDDTQLVYSNGSSIYRLNANGTGQVLLAAGFAPAWRR
jgi:Tol biopolymer transport system component